MQVYYRHAKAVTVLNTILAQNIGRCAGTGNRAGAANRSTTIFPVGQGHLLDIRDENLFQKTVSNFRQLSRPCRKTAELSGHDRPDLAGRCGVRNLIRRSFRARQENRAAFRKLLSDRGIVHEFRRMNQLDILGAYLSFRDIVGQSATRPFHVYRRSAYPAGAAQPAPFHDERVCHGIRYRIIRRNWNIRGCSTSPPFPRHCQGPRRRRFRTWAPSTPAIFCNQSRAHRRNTELVVWLVQNHLIMSRVAQEGHDRPGLLPVCGWLATCAICKRSTSPADIRGTSPKVWNHWKGKLLPSLFPGAAPYSGRAPATACIVPNAEPKPCTCCFSPFPTPFANGYGNSSIPSISLRHSAEEIAWHHPLASLPHLQQPAGGQGRPTLPAMARGCGDGLCAGPTRPVRPHRRLLRPRLQHRGCQDSPAAHGYALDSFRCTECPKSREWARWCHVGMGTGPFIFNLPFLPAVACHGSWHFPIKPDAASAGREGERTLPFLRWSLPTALACSTVANTLA